MLNIRKQLKYHFSLQVETTRLDDHILGCDLTGRLKYKRWGNVTTSAHI